MDVGVFIPSIVLLRFTITKFLDFSLGFGIRVPLTLKHFFKHGRAKIVGCYPGRSLAQSA